MKKQKRVASSTAVTLGVVNPPGHCLDFSNFPAVNGSIGVSASAKLSGGDAGRFKPGEVPGAGQHVDLRNVPEDWFTGRRHFDVVFQKKDA